MQVQNAGYYGCVGFYEKNDWATSRFFSAKMKEEE